MKKYISVFVIGVVVGYFLHLFQGKWFKDNVDLTGNTIVEYRDTCYSRVDTIRMEPVIRKGTPKKVVIVELDTVTQIEMDTVEVPAKCPEQYSWKEVKYDDGFLHLLDSVYVNGAIRGWRRDVTLDTMDLQTMFRETVVVENKVPVELKRAYVVLNGVYDLEHRFGVGAGYMYNGYGAGVNWYPNAKTGSVNVSIPLIKIRK